MVTFSMDVTQGKKLDKWMKKQERKTKGEYGAIGGGYTFKFTPTGLGIILEVENVVTKESINLTDYGHW